jgi:hypothetical protein
MLFFTHCNGPIVFNLDALEAIPGTKSKDHGRGSRDQGGLNQGIFLRKMANAVAPAIDGFGHEAMKMRGFHIILRHY